MGCRDIETQKRLDRNNIDNYFSGCMTLTTKKFENIKKQEYICVVDVSEKVYKKIQESTKREIKKITHSVNPDEIKKKSFEQRMNDVENLLKTYQAAHLVITSRLHVALPCIALGTPVILVIKEDYEKDRLETFLKYPGAYYFYNEFCNFSNEEIENMLNNPNKNNEDYLEIRNNLIERCNNFIEECENDNLNSAALPEVSDYSENYVKKIEWYKNLHENLRKKAKENIYQYDEEYCKYNEKIKELEDIINNKNTENSKLVLAIDEKNREQENQLIQIKKLEEENKIQKEILDNIYNSRSWKLLEKYRNVKKNLKSKIKKNGKVD